MLRASKSQSARRLICCGIGLAALSLLSAKVYNEWSRWPTQERLALGREIFQHKWEPGDSLAGEGDGLGPVFNARSCAECHFQGGVGGGGPADNNVVTFEAMPTPRRADVTAGVVHAFATSASLQESRDNVHRLYPVIPGGARVINGCSTIIADFDPVQFAEVNTPPLFGLGLVERIADFSIQTNAMRRTWRLVADELGGDFSGTPVGRVRVLPDGRIGRFGWKAQFATLEEFVGAACAVELGLTNPRQAQNVARKPSEDHDAKLDITRKQFLALVSFVQQLPRPVELLPDVPAARQDAERGRQLFVDVGCAECHVPNLGNVQGIYSDLRLYKIVDDPNRSYRRVEPELLPPDEHPQQHEWKTPPLWGVADSAPYFHDGASPTLRSAILRHAGHARKSREQFGSLAERDEQALIAFLQTLRAPARQRQSE